MMILSILSEMGHLKTDNIINLNVVDIDVLPLMLLFKVETRWTRQIWSVMQIMWFELLLNDDVQLDLQSCYVIKWWFVIWSFWPESDTWRLVFKRHLLLQQFKR